MGIIKRTKFIFKEIKYLRENVPEKEKWKIDYIMFDLITSLGIILIKAVCLAIIVVLGSGYVSDKTGNPLYGLAFMGIFYLLYFFNINRKEKLRRKAEYDELMKSCKVPTGRFG